MPARLSAGGARLDVRDEDVVLREGVLGLPATSQLIVPERPDLVFKPLNIRFPEASTSSTATASLPSAEDIVVHHPYESSTWWCSWCARRSPIPTSWRSVELYRTSKDSPIVALLEEAADLGKTVTAVVELKARFDEEADVRWDATWKTSTCTWCTACRLDACQARADRAPGGSALPPTAISAPATIIR